MIIQISENTFYAKTCNTELTLKKGKWGWEIYAKNPMTRACRTWGFKMFDTLEQVEAKYKVFRGIVALHAINKNNACNV